MKNITEMPQPLASLRYRELQTWQQWLAEWKRTGTLLGRLGLLNGVFDVQADDPRARICFLFLLADGWLDKGHDYTPGAQLSKKAASVLAYRYFNRPIDDRTKIWEYGHNPGWMQLMDRDGMLDDLLWFLRPDPNMYTASPYVSNIPWFDKGSKAERILRHFAHNLAYVAWGFIGEARGFISPHDLSDEVRLALWGRRADVLHILVEFGDLEQLLNSEVEVGQDSLDRLHEMALNSLYGRHEHGTHIFKPEETRPQYSSVREAMAAGSRVAQVLYLLEANIRYRQDPILDSSK